MQVDDARTALKADCPSAEPFMEFDLLRMLLLVDAVPHLLCRLIRMPAHLTDGDAAVRIVNTEVWLMTRALVDELAAFAKPCRDDLHR